jgi:hypothetical protein
MPFEVHLDESTTVLHIRGTGKVNDAELADLSKRVRQDPAFIAGCALLYDGSAATAHSLSANLIQSLAKEARGDKNHVAFVMPSAAGFGLARMYQILSDVENDRVQVFENPDDALVWLRSTISSRREQTGA